MTERPYRYLRHGPLGTALEVVLDFDDATSDEMAADLAGAWIIDEIEQWEAVFSVFNEESELSRWRRGDVDEVSPQLTAVLAAASEWQRGSSGALNPLASVVTDRWAQAAADGVRPSPTELATLAASIQRPAYDVEEGRVRRIGDCSAVSLNAIAKGAIVDLVVEAALERFSPARLTVSAGGDVRHHGTPAATVGIENPLRPYDNEPPLERFHLDGGAVATSGGARRGLRVVDEWVSHVVDPRTGHPARAVASASAVADDACTADAVATICTVMTPAEAMRWLDDVPQAEAILVDPGGELIESSGWWQRVNRLS